MEVTVLSEIIRARTHTCRVVSLKCGVKKETTGDFIDVMATRGWWEVGERLIGRH